MKLFNEVVYHKSFGKGLIVEHIEKYVSVLFENSQEVKDFEYPKAIGLYIELDNQQLMKEIEKEVQEAKIKEELEIEEKKEQEKTKLNKLKVNNDKTIEKQHQVKIETNDERYVNYYDLEDYIGYFDDILCNRKVLLKTKREQEEKIKIILKQRNIKYLVHFTRLDNLKSILNNGLVPVSLQEGNNIISFHNDDQRIDSQLNCTSCSVGFPNYKLFYKFRDSKYPGTKWVVIVLDTNVLFSPDNISYFCNTNAARVFSRFINSKDLCTAEAFGNMFYENIKRTDGTTYCRENLGICEYYTTDPQGEILISDIIDKKYFKSICFQDNNTINEFIYNTDAKLIDKFSFSVYPEFFNKRKDFMFLY